MASFSDTLLYSLIITLFGMGIVFIVLIALQYILKSLKVFFYKEKKGEAKVAQVQAAKAAEPVMAQAGGSESAEDDELVAVITAALISSLGGRSNIVVRNIRRAEDSAPVWSRVGRMEQTANRL